MRQHFQNNTWLYNNIIPITTTLVLWAVSFGVLTTKVDQVIKSQDQQYTMWLQLEKRVGQLELDTKVISERQDQVRTILKLK